MSKGGFPGSRREFVVHDLRQRIRSGELAYGQRLAGEHVLSQQYQVSRGTVRQALKDLQSRHFITTRAGVGSFVSFDGVRLDHARGWAESLADTGVMTQLLDISRIPWSDVPELQDTPADISHGIAIRRIRSLPDGQRVSYECSTVPAVGTLRELPRCGLPDGSITAALTKERLTIHNGRQRVRVQPLGRRVAEILRREPKERFLLSAKTCYNASGKFVEHVVSYLDPEHFQLDLTFGKEHE